MISLHPTRRFFTLFWLAAMFVAAPLMPRAAAQPTVSAEQFRRLEEAVKQLQQENEYLRKRLDVVESARPMPATTDTTTPPPVSSVKSSTPSTNLYGGTDLRWYWKNGMNFESGDKTTFKGKFGGRLQFDMAAFDQNKSVEAVTGDAPTGAEFRRARLYTSGEINLGAPIHYKTQIDFAGGRTRFADAYLGMNKIPYVGGIQFGQFYEPFSLEQNISDNYITLLERPLPVEAFSPARNVGVMLQNTWFDGRFRAAAGVFVDDKNDSADGDTFDSNSHVMARLTGLPWYDKESGGKRYLHLGVGGGGIDPENSMLSYGTRPEAHLAPRYLDTGIFAGDYTYLLGLEAALILGPFSIQGETMRTWVDTPANGTLSFEGFYAYASYFLTGEHRPYKPAEGVIDRVAPLRNFSLNGGGWGAWELAARLSHVNLNDGSIQGGRLNEYTAGVNWYLNPNSRFMLNYGYADLDRAGVSGGTHIFQTRVQVDF